MSVVLKPWYYTWKEYFSPFAFPKEQWWFVSLVVVSRVTCTFLSYAAAL